MGRRNARFTLAHEPVIQPSGCAGKLVRTGVHFSAFHPHFCEMPELPPLDQGELYRVLAESATDAIVTIDEDSRILSVNPAGERLFGVQAAEFVGRSLSAFMPERFRARHLAGMRHYCNTGERRIPWKAVEVPILSADGHEVPVEISFGELWTGGRRAFSAILRDISERVTLNAAIAEYATQLEGQAMELEQQLEEAQLLGEELEQANDLLARAQEAADKSSARVREVLDSLSDAVSVFDRDWRWTYVNPSARAVLASLGCDPDAVIGRELWTELPMLLGTPFEVQTRSAHATGSPVTYQEFLPALGRWFENRIVPSASGVTTFTRDVTEDREASEALKAREAEYEALANSIPTLAWMAEPSGWIFWYNERWYEYTGTTPADMEGWGWQRVHDPRLLPDVLSKWGRSIETGQAFEMTFPLRGADGSFRPFLTRVFPLRDATGAVVRWFGTNTDVLHEEQARRAAEHAEARTRQLQKLTALLAAAQTLGDVVSIVVSEATSATGAATGMFALRDDAGAEGVMLGETGLTADVIESYARFPLTRDSPAAECLRTGAAIFVGEQEGPDGLLARYPQLQPILQGAGRNAVATVPLVIDGRAAAAMSFTFVESQRFTEDDREFFLTLARQGAQAMARVEAFNAERRERRRSESILASITDGFVAFDRQLRFTFINERAARMFGVEGDTLLGRELASLPQGDATPFAALIQMVIDDRTPRTLEGFGTIMRRWLDMRAYPADDGGAVCYFQDVTERRAQQDEAAVLAEASAALATSPDYEEALERFARATVPRLGDWCAIDVLGAAEPPLARRLRRVALVPANERDAAHGEALRRLAPPDWNDRSLLATSRVLAGESVRVGDLTPAQLAAAASDADHAAALAALGAQSVMMVPLSSGGEVLGLISFFSRAGRKAYDDADLHLARNLGGRAAVMVERARLLAVAEEANAAKSEFLRTVSHELRQPLNAIGGLLQLWELGLRGSLSTEQQEDISRIKRNQRQLATLIEDLLSYARLEAGKLSVVREPLSLRSVLEELRAAIAVEVESRGLAYHDTLPPADLRAMGDADRLHQVLVNLVTNAARATAAGGRVTVHCEDDGSQVRVIVQDTGHGIPVEKLEAIFSPFVQVGRALNQPREGAGLGLAISRGLADAMGGSLTVASTVGAGSAFTVTLPTPDR